MVVLAWHLLSLPIAFRSDDLGPRAALPGLTKTVVVAKESWRIERVSPPLPKGETNEKGELSVRIAGRRVVLRPNDGYEHVDGYERGRDGSLLIHRGHREINWSSQDSILYRGRETVVPHGLVSIYRDRKDYAGSIVRETSGIGMPESAPDTFVVEDGAVRWFGPGSVRDWSPDGALVLEVPVNGQGQPSGTEFTVGSATRILAGGREWVVDDYGFAGRMKDGRLVFVSGATSSSVGNGFISLSKNELARDRVLVWKAGRFTSHTLLPPGWHVAGVSPDGWLLTRYTAPSTVEDSPPDTSDPEHAMAEMDRRQEEESDRMTDTERDWTAGVLRDGALVPIDFPRPKGTEGLLWRGGGTAYGPEAFRFSAFYGDDERHFRVSRR